MKLDHYGKCPKCGSSWSGGDMSETIRDLYSPPYKWSRLIGVEDPTGYDGVTWYRCPDCHQMWDRFTGKEVAKKS